MGPKVRGLKPGMGDGEHCAMKWDEFCRGCVCQGMGVLCYTHHLEVPAKSSSEDLIFFFPFNAMDALVWVDEKGQPCDHR